MQKQQDKQPKSFINEDQFFYALVITFLVFFLQFPEFDISTDTLHSFNNYLPHFFIITTRMLFITLLALSTITRYLTVTTNSKKRKTLFRAISACFLLSIPYYIVFDLSIRGLPELLWGTNYIFLIILTPVIQLGATFLIGRYIEKRWYNFYGYPGIQFGKLVFTGLGLFFLYLYCSLYVHVFLGINMNIVWRSYISFALAILTIITALFVNSRQRKKLSRE
jgi:hypothetical protein